MKKLLISLTVASLLSFSSYAINAMPRAHHDDQERMSMKRLNLSAQQKQDIKQILKETKQDLSVYRGEQKQSRESIRALMASDVWDEAAVRAAIEEQMTAQLQSKLIRAKSKNKVFNQLTQEQKSQFKANRLEKSKGKNRFNSNRMAKNAKKKMLRLIKALALSDQQQTQLLAMMETNKSLRQANREQASNMRTQLVSIVQAPSFDEAAWLAIHADNKQQKLDTSITKAKARFDTLGILNEEQRKKFAKIMKKTKRGKMNNKDKMRQGHRESNDKTEHVES